MQTIMFAAAVPSPIWQNVVLAVVPAFIVGTTAIVGQILAHRFALKRERRAADDRRQEYQLAAEDRKREYQRTERVRYFSDFLYQLEQAEYLIALLYYRPFEAPSDTPQELREAHGQMRQLRHRLMTVEKNVDRLISIEKLCNAVSACAYGLPDRLTDSRSEYPYLYKASEYLVELRKGIEFSLSERGHIVGVWNADIPRADELWRQWRDADKPAPPDLTS